MIVSDTKKFIFIACGSTGSTSIEKALCQWNRHGSNAFIGPDPFDNEQDKRRYSKHMAAVTLRDRMPNWEEYFKFSFVRNPWDRMVATCCRVEGSVSHQGIKKHVSLAHQRETKWKDQLARLTDENGKMIIDFVGKYENLQKDFDTVCDLIEVPRVELPRLNRTHHDHYSVYYDSELINIVAKEFQRDIDYFGYRLEPTCL